MYTERSGVYAGMTAGGRMLVYADSAGIRRPAIDLGDRGYFRRTVAERRPIVSEPVPGRISGEPVVVFTQPLVDAHGAVFGVLGGALRLASRDLLGEVDGAAEEAEVLRVVTDAQGRLLTHPLRRQLLQPVGGEQRLAEAFAEWERIGAPVEPSAGGCRGDARARTTAAGAPPRADGRAGRG